MFEPVSNNIRLNTCLSLGKFAPAVIWHTITYHLPVYHQYRLPPLLVTDPRNNTLANGQQAKHPLPTQKVPLALLSIIDLSVLDQYIDMHSKHTSSGLLRVISSHSSRACIRLKLISGYQVWLYPRSHLLLLTPKTPSGFLSGLVQLVLYYDHI
jgi:hypothetical protein